MSRLRSNPQNRRCQAHMGNDFSSGTKVDRGLCGDRAVIRCNACQEYFCEECRVDHLEMTVVMVDGWPVGLPKPAGA